MLPRANRLKKKDLEKVFKEGKGFKEGLLFLKIRPNNLKISRFGFVISRNLSKKAVVRNKIKRKLRESVRTKLKKTEEGIDGVVVAYPGLEDKSFSEIGENLNKIFKKAKIAKNKENDSPTL